MSASQAVWTGKPVLFPPLTICVVIKPGSATYKKEKEKGKKNYVRLILPVETMEPIQNYQPCHHLSLQAGFCSTLHRSAVSASVRSGPLLCLKIVFLEKNKPVHIMAALKTSLSVLSQSQNLSFFIFSSAELLCD